MKKVSFGRIALCAVIAALSACGDSDGSSTNGASTSSVATAASSTSSTTAQGSTAAVASSSATSGGVSSGSATASAAPSSVTVSSTVKLSSAAYSVAAAAGSAVVTVERVGSSGTTAIQYSTSNGSGVDGVDYTAASGSLTWADGDASIKKIIVPVNAKASNKTFHVALAAANSTAQVTAPNIATVTIMAPAEAIPPAAQQVGYSTQTFGPALTMGDNWHDFTFYGTTGIGGTNNSDGTVTVSGQGSGAISTATKDSSKPHLWSGVAFGGGAYFEAVFSFANADAEKLSKWPAFWASDIENMAAGSVTDQTQWLGQPAGYGNWIETDFFEYDRQNVGQYGVQIHNWHGFHSHGEVQDVTGYTSGMHVPAGFQWNATHKYGFLWVPATATTQGYVQAYLDDVPMGNPIYWNQYDPKAPPQPLVGTTAFSVLDARHLALIFDTGTHNPMTIHSVTVWQASAANNITQ